MRIIGYKDILKGMKDGIVRIVDHYGITCMIGNYSFYFADGELDDYNDLDEFLEDYSQEEIAGLIADTILDDGVAYENGIDEEDWNYIYEYLHRGENSEEAYIPFIFSYAEMGIIKQSLLDTMEKIEKTGYTDSDSYREVETLYNTLIRKI